MNISIFFIEKCVYKIYNTKIRRKLMEQDFVVNNNDSKVMEKFGIAIKKHGFCIIKNFVDEDTLRKKIKLFKASFSPDNDIRKSGPMKYKMKNF